MIQTTHRRRGRRAVAAVEFAAVLPLILTLLLGIWEVGRLIEIQQFVHNATREGARQAATGQLTNAQVQQVVINTLAAEGLPTANVVVTVKDLTTPANDVSAANYLDQIQITATIPYSDVRFEPDLAGDDARPDDRLAGPVGDHGGQAVPDFPDAAAGLRSTPAVPNRMRSKLP